MVNALGEKQRRAREEGHSHLAEEVAGLQKKKCLLVVPSKLIWDRDGISTVVQECVCGEGGE